MRYKSSSFSSSSALHQVLSSLVVASVVAGHVPGHEHRGEHVIVVLSGQGASHRTASTGSIGDGLQDRCDRGRGSFRSRRAEKGWRWRDDAIGVAGGGGAGSEVGGTA